MRKDDAYEFRSTIMVVVFLWQLGYSIFLGQLKIRLKLIIMINIYYLQYIKPEFLISLKFFLVNGIQLLV